VGDVPLAEAAPAMDAPGTTPAAPIDSNVEIAPQPAANERPTA
jgi:hypothetical protein